MLSVDTDHLKGSCIAVQVDLISLLNVHGV